MTLERPMFPPRKRPLDKSARRVEADLSPGSLKLQRDRESALRRIAKLRYRAAAEIERLIAFLDACDPYAAQELEQAVDDGPCDTDELERSWVGVGASSSELPWDDECEADYQGREANFEPSLGSVEGPDTGGQDHWAQGGFDDFEEQCDDEGVTA